MKKQGFDLKKAFPETPDMCREAVLHAVSTYREERIMKKKLVTILAATFAVILACSTALALVNYYSVREFVADGQGGKVFEENVMALGETRESNGFTFTLGDAVFDGTRFAATMNVAAEKGAESLYIYPQLEAWQGGMQLDVDFRDINGKYSRFAGFLYPGMDAEHPMDNLWGFDATLYEETEGEIEWKIRLLLCKVNWPVEEIAWNGESFEEQEDILRGDFMNETIRVRYGHMLDQYQSAICNSAPEWVNTCPYDGPFHELMTEAGAFTEVDTVVFDIETRMPEKKQLARGQVFSFEEYDVEVLSLTSSFMQVDYELEVRFHEKQESEHDLELSFTLLDQSGREMKWRDHRWALSEDGMTARVYGSKERITDEELTAVTFKLNEKFTMADYYKENVDRLTFTVEVPFI